MSSESNAPGYTEDEMNVVEAVLFSAPRPVDVQDLKKLLSSRHKGGVRGIIDLLNKKYEAGHFSFRIREIAEGFQFHLLPDYSFEVEKYFSKQRTRRLSAAGLETLAIIAYKQPISKGEVEHIRGVASDGVLQTLLERNLIKPAGRAERVGRPLLYATTGTFLEYFGINGLDQLPRLEEIIHKHPAAALQKSLNLELAEPTEEADKELIDSNEK
jgi:segregation and condensation protein B